MHQDSEAFLLKTLSSGMSYTLATQPVAATADWILTGQQYTSGWNHINSSYGTVKFSIFQYEKPLATVSRPVAAGADGKFDHDTDCFTDQHALEV